MAQPDDPTQTQIPSPAPDAAPASEEPSAASDPAAPNAPNAPNAPERPDTPDDLAAVRELILLAYQDIVPELIQGGTVAELQAAVEPARTAYRQVAERIASTPVAAPPAVPAGAASVVPPLDGLPPGELIKRGLQRRG